jgi:hypothetical protein
MRKIVTVEEITCDLCNRFVTDESTKVFAETTIAGEYITAAIDVTAIRFNREIRCICTDCKKALLNAAIERL